MTASAKPSAFVSAAAAGCPGGNTPAAAAGCPGGDTLAAAAGCQVGDTPAAAAGCQVGDTLAAAARCQTLAALAKTVASCAACPRLRTYCAEVAREKVRRYAGWTYWGRPVPSFGDPAARILLVGLAPAAHGGNRTGRMFTGDRSGDFLYAALHRVGLASQATSTHRDDGLTLHGVYITAAGHCAPPANQPTPAELLACRPYLLRELELLTDLRVIVALGALAHDSVLRVAAAEAARTPPAAAGRGRAARPRFAHGTAHPLDGQLGKPRLQLLDCYHVSQQNTFTGLLTPAMLDAVLQKARDLSAL